MKNMDTTETKPTDLENKPKSNNPNHLPSVRVVVARYEEPLDWLTTIPEDYEIYVSNSGKSSPEIPSVPNPVKVVQVPNEGREAGHWIRYIADNYNNLADINVFLQGSPHIGHTNDILFHMERSDLFGSFRYLTSKDNRMAKIEGEGRALIQSAVGRKYVIVPMATGGVWGAQHYATKETIRNYHEEHYRMILKYANTPKFGNKLEHAYNCVYGIPPIA